MIGITNASALLGTTAVPITIEANVERGLPRFTIVGLREADARETRERVRCGLLAIGVELPTSRVTINLAPADLPKAGAAFDLPITLALLVAMGHLKPDRVAGVGSQGELGLDGTLRPVLGVMAGALCGARASWSEFIVAGSSAGRAAHASIPVRSANSLEQVVAHLTGKAPLADAQPLDDLRSAALDDVGDMSDVRGQGQAVEALRVAAAGGHSLLLAGPPGCGKTMIASRLPSVLPKLSGDEALEVATVHDAAGLADGGVGYVRPFRMPHHSMSVQGMVGGGSGRPVVGELSLAHHGVLFLDELPEYRPSVLDSLRQPLEDRCVVIRRARWVVRYPADTQLVAAMNLCRCGRHGTIDGEPCTCTDVSRLAYLGRVSGAIMDRFDIRLRVRSLAGAITDHSPCPSSAEIRASVASAQQRQQERLGTGRRNANVRTINTPGFELDRRGLQALQRVSHKGALSARSQRAVIRVARTVADLADVDSITEKHLAKAFVLCRGSDDTKGQTRD